MNRAEGLKGARESTGWSGTERGSCRVEGGRDGGEEGKKGRKEREENWRRRRQDDSDCVSARVLTKVTERLEFPGPQKGQSTGGEGMGISKWRC